MAATERFLSQAEASFNALARHPAMGSQLKFKHPDLAGMRKWRIKDFDNHLVFYQPNTDGVTAVLVLHAASNWWSLLDINGARSSTS